MTKVPLVHFQSAVHFIVHGFIDSLDLTPNPGADPTTDAGRAEENRRTIVLVLLDQWRYVASKFY